MARRKARSSGKLEPAVKTLIFSLPAGNRFIDLSQVCSIVNRRFYRQGLNWAVSSLEVQAIPNPAELFATGTVRISKIPDTWIASNAWEKGMRSWLKLQNEAVDELPSVKPKFLDFKVYADADHHALGSGANLMPLDFSGLIPPVKGEWEYSKAIIPITEPDAGAGTTAERDFVWTGANYPGTSPTTGNNAVSLIEGYAASRGLPDIRDPNAPDDADDTLGGTPENWIAAIFNEGLPQDHEVIEDMLTENNLAPYPFENGTVDGVTFTDTMYPGGANQIAGMQLHDELLITSTTVGGSDTSPGTNFQGGLIRFDSTVENGTLRLILRLVPGPHRGYLCQPQKDV